jgi:hypothetical protein
MTKQNKNINFMKARSLNLLRSSITILTLFLFSTCNKSGDSQNASGSFTWTWSGTNYTGNFKEAFLQGLGPTPMIISGTGDAAHTAGTGPRITVNSLNVGTYTLGGGITNYISFIAPNGDNLQSTTGTLNITANANSKLSGDFSATLINGVGQTSLLTGSFSNIKINF